MTETVYLELVHLKLAVAIMNQTFLSLGIFEETFPLFVLTFY